MLSHFQIWQAIDALAAKNGLSPSALARRAGLSPTALNPSKRVGDGGRPRWPSTESVAKILAATNASLADLIDLLSGIETRSGMETKAVGSERFGRIERPAGFSEPELPPRIAGRLLAVPFPGFPPLYRVGDQLVVRQGEAIRPGDRVVAFLPSGEFLAGEVVGTKPDLRLAIPGRDGETVLSVGDIGFLARILWASQ